jgi:hypothetical protein
LRSGHPQSSVQSRTPNFYLIPLTCVSHPRVASVSVRRACSSQLGDPDDAPEPHPRSRLSPKDFAFLHESLSPLPAAALPPSEVVLISKAIRAYGADFDGKAERFLRRHREFLTDVVVVAVLRSVRVPELCVMFFLWVEGQVGYSHTGACYDALAEVLDFARAARVLVAPPHTPLGSATRLPHATRPQGASLSLTPHAQPSSSPRHRRRPVPRPTCAGSSHRCRRRISIGHRLPISSPSHALYGTT